MRWVAIVLVLWVIGAPLQERGSRAWNDNAQASKNIWEQPYQMGRFLSRYYADEAVAVNDIGSPAWLGAKRIVDLWGMATVEVASHRLNQRYNTSAIDQVTRDHDVQVAIIYDHWYQPLGGLPGHWKKAGEWSIRNNVVTGGTTYSIYSVDPEGYDRLNANLREFAPDLPRDVFQSGAYVS
jgi:hypothetical protein